MSNNYNQLDKNSKKTGLWKEKESFYTFGNHTDVSKGYYVDGLRHGLWKIYSDGKLCFKIQYKIGRPCGRFISYNQNGNVIQEILFVI